MAFTPPPHLSPSSINTFQTCPLKFKYSKIDGIREPATEATLMGNFVHEVLELLYAQPHEVRTPDLAKNLARSLWDEKYSDEAIGVVREQSMNDFRWRSWFCIENLWKLEDPTQTNVDEIEYELNGDLNGVTLKGFVDRFHYDEDGRIVVGDYKTGKVPGKNWEDDKFFQLYIYAALLQELNVGDVSKVELIYLKGPKVLNRTVTPDDLEKAVETVVTVKRDIDECCETETFNTKTSRLCDWCYFKKQCPAWA